MVASWMTFFSDKSWHFMMKKKRKKEEKKKEKEEGRINIGVFAEFGTGG